MRGLHGLNRAKGLMMMGEMAWTQRLQGFDFTKEAYTDWSSGLVATGCAVDDLGLCSDGVNHVWGLSYGDAGKPVIMLIGVIHGLHEWPNAYILRQFMTDLVNPPSSHKAYFDQILAKFSFYCIPCANPYGYINNFYHNANDVNLNRNFDYEWAAVDPSEHKGAAPFSEVETQIIRDKVQALDPVGFLDCHVEGGDNGFQIEVRPPGVDVGFWDGVRDTMLPLTSNLDYTTNMAALPQASQWVRDNRSSLNRYPLSGNCEPGELETDNEKARLMLNFLLQYCTKMNQYIQPGTPTVIPLQAAGDTQIASGAPTLNYGLGPTITIGYSPNSIRRVLMRFDLAGIPVGSLVNSATLRVYCEGESSATDRTIGVHRALTQWWEGLQSAVAPPAGQDGSTWNLRNANGPVAWGAVGGQAGVDYTALATDSKLFVNTNTAYEFDVTADVQDMVNGGNNYGWWLINSEETVDSRKFITAREGGTAGNRPVLTIDYMT